MKQTTKPKDTKQSHLLKRHLAGNVAALPLPIPLSGEGGEGRWSSPWAMDLQFPQFPGIASRRDEPLMISLVACNHLPVSDYQSPITIYRFTNV